mgnify:FL=1
MIQVHSGIHVGTVADLSRWRGKYLAAAKEPCHRDAVGYTGRGCPKDHPEYFVAVRNKGMILNLVDGESSDWVDKGMMQQALAFITPEPATLIVCNQGHSRSPSIALMWLLQNKHIQADTFEEAEKTFSLLYKNYRPANGIRQFSKQFFEELQ